MTVSPAPSQRILAGVDIGTLTCRLLIAELSSAGHVKELRSDRRILRLGENVDRERVLRADAMERVITTLKEWRQVIEECHADATIAVATSAVRDARNRDEFLDRVKRETGFEVEIISGEEEARRTLLGIRSGLPASVTDMLALDIGGGSTEFILDRPGRPSMMRSIDIGVVRLSERILRHDPPTVEEVERARKWVRDEATRGRGYALPEGNHPCGDCRNNYLSRGDGPAVVGLRAGADSQLHLDVGDSEGARAAIADPAKGSAPRDAGT
jgi:exopolyphosphatase / guanosine-5'-triphosphate,3'-diphosphate pyrophosphatase